MMNIEKRIKALEKRIEALEKRVGRPEVENTLSQNPDNTDTDRPEEDDKQ